MNVLRCQVIKLEIVKEEDKVKMFSNDLFGIWYLKKGQKKRNENWRNTSKYYLSIDLLGSVGIQHGVEYRFSVPFLLSYLPA